MDMTTIRPATDLLIASLGETVGQINAHEHPERGGDLYCLNLTSFLGDRMGPVLRRLADEQTETQKWKDKHTALADEFAAETEKLQAEIGELTAQLDTFEPVTYPDGDQLFMHECRHIEWWNEQTRGPINDQGCDGCESGPFLGGWRPLYVGKAEAK